MMMMMMNKKGGRERERSCMRELENEKPNQSTHTQRGRARAKGEGGGGGRGRKEMPGQVYVCYTTPPLKSSHHQVHLSTQRMTAGNPWVHSASAHQTPARSRPSRGGIKAKESTRARHSAHCPVDDRWGGEGGTGRAKQRRSYLATSE